MFKREIQVEDIEYVLKTGIRIKEVILKINHFQVSSCWVLSITDHCMLLHQPTNLETVIITTYEPDVKLWDDNFTTKKRNIMTCLICKNGTTRKGKVTVTLERGRSIIAIKEVPAQICQNCGEYYLDAEMTKEVLRKAEQAAEKGVIIEVITMDKVA